MAAEDDFVGSMCYKRRIMTILDRAIAKVRTLSQADQDALGAVLLSLAEEWTSIANDLDHDTQATIREGLAQAQRREFVPDEDIRAIWKRYGL